MDQPIGDSHFELAKFSYAKAVAAERDMEQREAAK